MVQAAMQMLWEVIAIVFILIMLVVISGLTSPEISNAFSAKGNVDILAAKINEVCLTGQEQTIENFQIPQGTLADEISLVQQFLTKKSGDPDYVVYYEAFPPGEALGWELYHDFSYRLIVPYDNNNNNYLQEALSDAINLRMGDDEDLRNEDIKVLISNVILSDNFGSSNYFTGNFEIEEENTQSLNKIGEQERPWGKWKTVGKNLRFYEFTNYVGMSNLEKTSVKYVPCGDNSLCLKTSQGVFAYNLTACEGIDFIRSDKKNREIENDFDSNNKAIPSFQIASPCKIKKLIIKLHDCNNQNYCQNFKKINLYRKDKEDSDDVKNGDHWLCKHGDKNNINDKSNDGPDKCINIEFKDHYDDYCHSPYYIQKIDFGTKKCEENPIRCQRFFINDNDYKGTLLRPNKGQDIPDLELWDGWRWP